MGDSIETIAATLRAAEERGYLPGRIALHAVLADEVVLGRIPALPEDGPRERDRFLEMWRTEAATYERALEGFHQEDVVVTTEGDRIRLNRTLCATGEGALRVPVEQVFTVADGRVVAIEVRLDPDDAARMRSMIQASGLPHADLRPSAAE